MKFSTKAIHVGQAPDPTTGAVIPPIYATSTYAQASPGVHSGFDYSRTANPTRSALEECLASLENAPFGLAFASGVAATSAVLNLLSAGDHVVVGDDVYGGTFRLFDKVFRRYGIEFTWVDASRPELVEAALRPQTRLIWVETPTNPLLKLVDLEAISRVSKSAGVPFAVDNTFATPYFQNPLDWGADIVVHSTTKYIGGHSDVVGGAVLTHREDLYQTIKFHQNAVGGIPSPFDCWLTLRGLKTLAVRMRQHEASARRVAEMLTEHRAVDKVFYPGLPQHPGHAVAARQMRGFGGMVSFTLRGGFAAAQTVSQGVRLFTLAESLGGVESLMCHPVTMTHGSIPKDVREARGVVDGLLRLSVGIEDEEDLLTDLQNALDAVPMA
ncbi:MAG: cystathionine gamma-synthase [Candidatus Sericytochromatia bacterium]|nr:cystathionine gamma-synthase [Candidatus Sericytochromatia bacterium]